METAPDPFSKSSSTVMQPPELLLSGDPKSTHDSTGVSAPPGPIRGHAAYPSVPRMTYLHLLPRELREEMWSFLFLANTTVGFKDAYSLVHYMDDAWDAVIELM